MKPLEKFLKKQTNALTRAGGFGGEKAVAGTSAARRRASLSRVVPFFRESSPEGGPARGDVFSPETEEAPCWPSAAATDIRSPSLSSDEQSSEASLDTGWTPLPADTPENLALALLDSVAGKRYGNCTEILLDDFMLTHPIFLASDKFQQVLLQQFGAEPKQGEGWPTWDGAERKQAVLSVAFRYLDTYRELLQEEGDRSNSFPK
ncbi:rap guanine nucleotide exchange factor-like 1, partial [Clarias magur]